jgi:hypothetical protein
MIRTIGAVIALLALAGCSKPADPVEQALATLEKSDDLDAFVVFADPDRNRFVQFSNREDGDIEFQFPIRTVYLEGGLKPLLFDVIAKEMPTEGIIDTMETLSPDELRRLKRLLSDRSIPFTESFRGGRDPADGPTRAYMHQIKGRFDPDTSSGRDFVDAVFRDVYLYDKVPVYSVKTNKKQNKSSHSNPH